MTPTNLKATVQYQDFEGSAAADHHDKNYLNDLAIRYAIDTKKYFVIGIQVWIGENRDIQKGGTYIDLLAVDISEVGGDIDSIVTYKENNNRILPYTKFRIEIDFEELIEFYFKRFAMTLIYRNLSKDTEFKEIEL
ncbi:MAG: hypothetical protein K8S20_00575 [Chloroflexi bacterium]|nr:hypothetical protein [Chloroflexota bacterium]